jgi:Stress responsive A/B Barrel Domain
MLDDSIVPNGPSIVRLDVLAIDYRRSPLFHHDRTMSLNTSATLRHVVLFAFKESATIEQIDAVVADFGTLKDRIPGIVAYEWGTNVSPEGLNQGFTHGFTLTFGSEEDRNGYLLHAAHHAFVDTLAACLERSLVFDYWAQ